MSARRQIIAALSENRGGIATLYDVAGAQQLADAHQTEVRREDAALIENAACDADWSATPAYCQGLRAGAELLLAKTTEKATAEATTATPDFFQPGHTYAEPDGTTDWKFRVDVVTTHPADGERTALGWRHFRSEWEPYAYGEDDFEIHQLVGYTDATDAGENR